MILLARDREDGVFVGLIEPDILIQYRGIRGDFLTRGLTGVIDVVLCRPALGALASTSRAR
jgi:hypothetical protein